jgi:hypothetical protein
VDADYRQRPAPFPDEVWRALTDAVAEYYPARLHEWAPFDADGSAGNRVKLATVGSRRTLPEQKTRADAPSIRSTSGAATISDESSKPAEDMVMCCLTLIGRPCADHRWPVFR